MSKKEKLLFSSNVSVLCGYIYEVCFIPVIHSEAGLPNMRRLKEFGGVSVIVSAAVRSSNESDVANAASVKNPSRFLWLHVPILLLPFYPCFITITFLLIQCLSLFFVITFS